MRLKTVLFIAALLGAIGCSSDKKSYLADANVTNNGNALFAVHRHANEQITIDTLIPNGDFFRIKGEDPDLSIVDLLSDKRERLLTLYLRNGIRLSIKGDISKPKELRVSGDPLNEQINNFTRDLSALLMQIDSLDVALTATPTTQSNRITRLNQESDSLRLLLKNNVQREVQRNPEALSSALLIHHLLLRRLPTLAIDSLILLLDTAALSNAGIVGEELRLFHREASIGQFGTPLPAYSLTNTDGETLLLNKFSPKVHVLHFWNAQIFDPYVAERLNTLYAHFGDSLLQVSTIALENDTLSWKKEAANLFPNLTNFREPLGFNAPALRTLDISELPTTLILTRESKIFAREVSPDRLLREIGAALVYRPAQPTKAVKRKPISETAITTAIEALLLPPGYSKQLDGTLLHQTQQEKEIAHMTTPLRHLLRPDTLLRQPLFIQYPPNHP